MAQLNITLNQEEILQLLSKDRGRAFPGITSEQHQQHTDGRIRRPPQLEAEPYERSEERTDSRNGARERDLKTRIGRIALTVPRRGNVPFKTPAFENYSQSEAALIASMAEMVINGVATRRVTQIMETLCGTSCSKSTVSEVCKDLDAKVREFRERPLTENYPFLSADAAYFKARVNHRIVSRAFMIAYGTNSEGHRGILGSGVYNNESKATWNAFLQCQKDRGLNGLLMIASDAREGIQDAVSRAFLHVPWQRRQLRFSRNISEKAPEKRQAAVRANSALLGCSRQSCQTGGRATKAASRLM